MTKEFRPVAMINITNRCTLRCKHCFVYREGTPNTPQKDEMTTNQMIKEIKKYRRKFGIIRMVWMGGEPLLRKDVLKRGIKLFPQNTITTNGTLPLIENWCNLYGLNYLGEKPEVAFNLRQEMVYSKKWVREKPILLIQTNGGPLNDQPYPYSWTRDMPKPLAQY